MNQEFIKELIEDYTSVKKRDSKLLNKAAEEHKGEFINFTKNLRPFYRGNH